MGDTEQQCPLGQQQAPTVQVTVRQQGRQEQLQFEAPVAARDVKHDLEAQFGAGLLLFEGSNMVLAATRELQPSERCVYEVSARE